MVKRNSDKLIIDHGGYRNLKSYQKAEIVYDGTISFTSRFLHPRDRTVDQMVQAARSGKQNIAEGSIVSGTSKEIELKLTNVARASLEELRLDYEDYLRNRKVKQWGRNHRLVERVRELNRSTAEPTYHTFAKAIEHADPEICANVMICLIHLATYLLAKQLKVLEQSYLKHGGFRERMYAARLKIRS